ncbi:hypothetical protein [Gordonia effusa]|nr:hypothetical protein [Gordonia effusa]
MIAAVVGVVVVVIAVAVAATVASRSVQEPSAELSDESTRVVYGDPNVPTSVLASRELFSSAPTVVIVGPRADDAASRAAGETAEKLRIPVFAYDAGSTDAVRGELARLNARSAVLVGDATDSFGLAAVAESSAKKAVSVVPDGRRVVVLIAAPEQDALATIAAAGAVGADASGGDPRSSSSAVEVLKADPAAQVVGIGGEFGTAALLSDRVVASRRALELPGGGLTVFPGRRMIALYGSPNSPSLGPLGRQDLPATIARAKRVAAQYDSVSKEKVIPAFEIIVTVASASPGPGNNYTSIIDPAVIKPWVEAAGKAGIYVTLDLQPGRMDFLRQAKMYESLLKLPHVGLALDSEWRLKPNQVHLTQIGSVEAAEVNRTSAWLAALVRDNGLPQKVLILHEFDSDMLANRRAINTAHPELAMVIHADGHGTPPVKMGTWNRLITDLPPNVWMGWKNFYTEDHPTFTPAQTMRVAPAPWFVSYQ